MYQIRNDEDEFEPRVTPKPASKLDVSFLYQMKYVINFKESR